MSGSDSVLFHSTEEQNFLKFAGEMGRCFYVPAYQRYYVWKKPDVDRFFLDIVNGMNELCSNQQEVTFIGTITCFRDEKYETIEPKVRKDVPASVMNIVDGQQRITTLMAAALLVHDFIRVHAKNCSSEWLRETVAIDHLNNLMRTFEMDKKYGKEPIYPKMIRAFDDVWSVDPVELSYSSPLSNLLFQYGKHYRHNNQQFSVNSKSFSFPKNLNKEQRDAHENFLKLISRMQIYIDSICNKGHFEPLDNAEDRVALPEAEDFTQNEKVVSDICNLDKLPDDSDISVTEENQEKLIRAFFLSSYILNRVHFVTLLAPHENQVYDIFDALNTTGQDLTALETFKPEVILFEGLGEFNKTISYEHFSFIDDFIGTLKSNEESKKVSAEIVTDFAYAETGDKLSRQLGPQRGYLRKQFNFHKNDKESGREFVAHLRYVSEVVNLYWYKTGSHLLEFAKKELLQTEENNLFQTEIPCVQLCLKYLNKANHTICRPLVSRFLHQLYAASEENKENAFIELFEVIKASAAFFALWRSTRNSSERIDDWYRAMYKNKPSSLDELSIRPCAPINRNSEEFIHSSSVKDAFRLILKENNLGSRTKIVNCSTYKEKVYQVPIYRTQRATAKFLLLISSHDAVMPQSGEPGVLVDGKEGVNPTLSGETWEDPNFDTVEHIIPQSMKGEVHPDEAMGAEILNRIGNLTLLPKKINSLLGDDKPKLKSSIYRAISAQTPEETTTILEEIDPPVSRKLIAEILKLHFNKLLALVYFTEPTKEDIDRRSKNIAERAWKILYEKWLDGKE